MASKGEAKNPYTYRPLLVHPNSIRLLRLLSATGAENPVCCQIFDYSLTTPARTSHLYECLSYVWGHGKDRSTIYVDDAELAVTRNLYGALRRLRDPCLDRILWIDALCINQNDVQERAQQVQIMAMIYAYASRVIVWLGEEADGSKNAMELLQVEASRMYRQHRTFQVAGIDELHEEEKKIGAPDESLELAPSSVESSAHSSREKVIILLRRPWFRRIWVLQEIAAAGVLVVLCGSEEITGACFSWGLSGLLEWCSETTLCSMVSSILYLLGDAGALRLNRSTEGGSFRLGICPFPHLMDMFRLREATDRRDKVYALLGMMSRGPMKIDITPDYSTGWPGLFRTLVHSILGQKVETIWVPHDGKEYGQLLGKGCTIGYISSVGVKKNDRQVVYIAPTYQRNFVTHENADEASLEWILHNSATPVRADDIVCWLDGSTWPTIIRSEGPCFNIVVILASLPKMLAKTIFREGYNSMQDEIPSPAHYSRDFVLTWSFDSEWTTQWGKSLPSPEEDAKILSDLSRKARVLEDANQTEALHALLEQVSDCQVESADIMDHFRDLRLALPNWYLYLQLKHTFQYVFRVASGSTADLELDIVKIRTELTANPKHGMDLITLLFDELPFRSTSATGQDDTLYDERPLLQLAFLFDVWGHTITPDTTIALVESVERMERVQRATFGNFPGPFNIELIDVLIQSTAQHPEWGKMLIQRLLIFAKGDVNRMYCLLRPFIICSAASPKWKQTVVEGVLATHCEELSEAVADKDVWSSMDFDHRYMKVVDFLWSRYVLHEKDLVGISSYGRFLLRSQLMEKFVNDYRVWKACYDGNPAGVRGNAGESELRNARMQVICKDMGGRWCRVNAFEAAEMHGHVECLQLLMDRGLG